MLFRNARVLPFLLIALGVGLVGWYGEQRWQQHQPTEAEIDEAAQLKLAIELHQRGPHLRPTGDRLAELYATVRAETAAGFRREREQLERWIGVGALLCVFGAGLWLKELLGARLRSN